MALIIAHLATNTAIMALNRPLIGCLITTLVRMPICLYGQGTISITRPVRAITGDTGWHVEGADQRVPGGLFNGPGDMLRACGQGCSQE